VLAEGTSLDAAAANALQNDLVSGFALRMVAALEDHEPRSDGSREALRVLRAWDGRVEKTGAGRLYHAFARDLAARLGVSTWGDLDRAMQDPAAHWDDAATPGIETRADVFDALLSAALAGVRGEDGPDPASWSWGRIHVVRFEHPLSPGVPWEFLRDLLDVGPIGMPGDFHTLNVQGSRIDREPRIRHIPSARLVVDLGDPDASTLVVPLGQSGHRADRHYADQLEAWAEGRTFPLPFSPGAVERATVSVLLLTPGPQEPAP
jgi:penicillin amidase